MSAGYQAVLWNRQKKLYDKLLLGFVVVYLILFSVLSLVVNPEITQETLILRSTSTLAFLLLHVILMIGPLSRINRIFLPLLYNRRHLGVTMFTVAGCHGVFSIIQFHSLSDTNPIVSVFTSNLHYDSLTRFPFQTFGFFSLVILFLMASTSHDFWLHNLGAKFWKTLHMLVYLAYALIVVHVLTGVLQYETSPVFTVLIGIGLISVITAHLIAGQKEVKQDRGMENVNDEFVPVCRVDEIMDKRAKIVCIDKERIAIFNYDGKVSAVSNVCKHQNGPLGEGRIVDGCITCPWHGYQYLPHNGSSPPPFKEMVSTYDVKIIDNQIWVNPKPYPEGTERPPAIIKV